MITLLSGFQFKSDCQTIRMEFQRPENLKFPQIYKTFTANEEEFFISDLTEEHTEEALALLVKYVIPEENFCKAFKIHAKPNAVKIMSDNYRSLISKRTSLACFKNDTSELIGLNILGVNTKGVERVLTVSSKLAKYLWNDDPMIFILGQRPRP